MKRHQQKVQAEVAFYKSQELQEIAWREPETFTFHDYLADFRADFHDIRKDPSFKDCLDLNSYFASQSLARELLASGSVGVLYPSVPRARGTCLACFRPALVTNVRQDRRVTVTFSNAQSAPVFS